MMKANSFRLGNYYHFETEIGMVVERVDYIENNMVDVNPMDLIHPIKLTDDWLLDFGFEKNELKTVTYWELYHFKLIKGLKRSGYPYHLASNIFNTKPVMYVHELQNLHFALTGEELKLQLL